MGAQLGKHMCTKKQNLSCVIIVNCIKEIIVINNKPLCAIYGSECNAKWIYT